MSDMEQTLSIIKPDAVERNLTESIKEYFLKNKLKILIKMGFFIVVISYLSKKEISLF